MDYQVRLTSVARRDLLRIPDFLQDFVADHLAELAKCPSEMSRSVVSPPFAPGGMMCNFTLSLPGSVHSFTILFKYGVDEITLIITGIGYSDLNPGDQ